jgi:DNA-binding transcriptional LysR family regulator
VTETQLRVLVAVADAKGFSAGAARLEMSQPAASRAVARLEAELGVHLLTRTPGAVVLTNVGLRVAMHAREVLARIEAMRELAGAVQGGYPGRLRVGSLPSVSARLLSPILGRFCAAHPGVDVELVEAPDDIVLAHLRDRTVDVGVIARHGADVEGTVLERSALLVAVRQADPLARRGTIGLSELTGEPLISARSGFEHLVDDEFRAQGSAPRPAFDVQETASALRLVAEGLGVAVVPELLTGEVPDGVALRPLEPRRIVELSLAVKSRADATPLALALLDTA